MNHDGSYYFKDMFPNYESLDNHTLPDVVEVNDQGLLIDAQENILAFRGLKSTYDPDLANAYNGERPGINNAFYGPGLYAANTDAALRPLGLKGDRLLIRVSKDADLADLRTVRSAHAAGGAAVAAALAAVKWAGVPPQLTHGTFEGLEATHDALVVPPSATYQMLKAFSLQKLPKGRSLSPTWMVLHDTANAEAIGISRRKQAF